MDGGEGTARRCPGPRPWVCPEPRGPLWPLLPPLGHPSQPQMLNLLPPSLPIRSAAICLFWTYSFAARDTGEKSGVFSLSLSPRCTKMIESVTLTSILTAFDCRQVVIQDWVQPWWRKAKRSYPVSRHNLVPRIIFSPASEVVKIAESCFLRHIQIEVEIPSDLIL